MNCIYFIVIVPAEAIAWACGLILIFKPRSAIDLQIRFYRLINWRIEPISLDKEIRNTRIMGAFLIILACSALLYLVLLAMPGNLVP